MPDNPTYILGFLFLGVWLLAAFAFIVKKIKNRCSPVKTVKAVVIDKHKIDSFSRYSGTGKREKYVVTFSAEGKKRSFYVSEFSYGGYRKNETGTLKYKGDRLIDFS